MKFLENNKIVLIGASTGGPAHIEKILTALPEPLPYTVVIAQHMGSEFLPSFVKRLALKTGHCVELCIEGERLEQGRIYIATNLCTLDADAQGIKFRVEHSSDTLFNPDINQLFASALALLPSHKLLAVLLTGIGDDGVQGCKLLSDKGAKCIAESEKTAIVYGIPARAKESIANIDILELDAIIQAIQIFGGD